MLDARWHKVLIDLWSNRMRTLVVALAVAVGVYAVGVVVDIRVLLVREYSNDQTAALPASAILHTTPFDDDLAERIAQIPGVAAAEGRAAIHARVTGPDGELRDLIVVAMPNFGQAGVDAVTPIAGAVEPGKREIILERMAPDYLGTAIGQEISLEFGGDATKILTVAGTAHDAQQLSPGIAHETYGYVSLETMDALGLGDQYSELHLRVSESAQDRAHIQSVVDQVEEHLERTGRPVLSTAIVTESYIRPYIDTLVLLLSSVGALILLLSGFLVVNAITALVAQQVPQIGVMKLIGARRSQIVALYLVTTLVYGALAVVMALPLAALTARLLMTELVEDLVNVMSDSYALSVPALAFQVALGLLLPLLAGLMPVLKGTRITTHRALNDVGLNSSGYGKGPLERLLKRIQRMRSVQRPLLLAVRNALRHKGRLAQTLVILVVGTALFVSVLSVRSSVNATLADFMRYHGYDASVALERPYRLAQIEEAMGQMGGILAAEGWSLDHAIRARPDGTDSDPMRLVAIPASSELVSPEPSAGRWFLPEGTLEVVINSEVLEKEPDLRVGSQLELEIDGREAVWHVVGIVPTESRGEALYVDLDQYGQLTRTVGEVTHLQVVTDRHDAGAQRALAEAVRAHLEERGFDVSTTETAEAINSGNRLMFTVVVAFLVLMALLLAAVGGLGLTTTMSINVLERVREIGVLRAIGASNLSVRRIVLAEGLAIGLVSWALGILLSVPVSAFMSEQVGLALLDVPLTYQYSLLAAAAWFFALQGVAVAASLGPARDAVRLTVREVLAYE